MNTKNAFLVDATLRNPMLTCKQNNYSSTGNLTGKEAILKNGILSTATSLSIKFYFLFIRCDFHTNCLYSQQILEMRWIAASVVEEIMWLLTNSQFTHST